jgi:hypothetical protein
MRHSNRGAAALFSAAPVSAENISGGPLQQNGKCWHGEKHSSPSEASWGYWGFGGDLDRRRPGYGDSGHAAADKVGH